MNIQTFLKRRGALKKKVETLEKEKAFLMERLAKYEDPQNNPNSSGPPFRDENRPEKNQSLPTASGKKP